MPSECPNCRRPVSWIRTFSKPAWGRWNCPGCGALLGIDKKRRLLGMFPWAVILLVLIKFVDVTSMGLLVALPVILAAAIACFYLIDRVVVIQPTGFLCKSCGYDLWGQTEPRCPECGSAFELSALRAHQQGHIHDQRARRRWGFGETIGLMLLVAVFMATLILGILAARRRPAPPTTIPATAPAQQPDKPAD